MSLLAAISTCASKETTHVKHVVVANTYVALKCLLLITLLPANLLLVTVEDKNRKLVRIVFKGTVKMLVRSLSLNTMNQTE